MASAASRSAPTISFSQALRLVGSGFIYIQMRRGSFLVPLPLIISPATPSATVPSGNPHRPAAKPRNHWYLGLKISAAHSSSPRRSLLNLLEFASGRTAELGARPAQVVGSEMGKAELAGIAEHDPPDHLRRYRGAR